MRWGQEERGWLMATLEEELVMREQLQAWLLQTSEANPENGYEKEMQRLPTYGQWE